MVSSLIDLLPLVLGGANLAFVIKILMNDLHTLRDDLREIKADLKDLRKDFTEHLKDHASL